MENNVNRNKKNNNNIIKNDVNKNNNMNTKNIFEKYLNRNNTYNNNINRKNLNKNNKNEIYNVIKMNIFSGGGDKYVKNNKNVERKMFKKSAHYHNGYLQRNFDNNNNNNKTIYANIGDNINLNCYASFPVKVGYYFLLLLLFLFFDSIYCSILIGIFSFFTFNLFIFGFIF